MMVGKLKEEEQISAVREFNRFYTARLGLLRKRHLDGDLSLTEARILYEIGARPRLTASSLRETLGLNAGYISRSLALLTKRKLVRQTTSSQDGREKLLTLSPAGDNTVAWLNEQLHFSTELTGWIMGTFGLVVWFLPILGGTLAGIVGFDTSKKLARATEAALPAA